MTKTTLVSTSISGEPRSHGNPKDLLDLVKQDLDGIVDNFASVASFFGTSTKTLISDAESVRIYFAKVFRAYAPVKVGMGQVTVTELSADSVVITGFDRCKVTVNGEPVEAVGRISMAVAV